jgi:hypothetical protein
LSGDQRFSQRRYARKSGCEKKPRPIGIVKEGLLHVNQLIIAILQREFFDPVEKTIIPGQEAI